MPSEIELIPINGDPIRTEKLEPNEHYTIHDGRGEDKRLVGVRCHLKDLYTEVFEAADSDVPKIKGRIAKKIPPPLFAEHFKIATIYSGHQPEFGIRNVSGEAVRLVIRHTRENYPEGQSPEEFQAP